MSKKNRKHRKEGISKGLDSMIRCPSCEGLSYPLMYSDPKNEVEEKAVICGACKLDLRPFITAMEAYEEDQKLKQTHKEELVPPSIAISSNTQEDITVEEKSKRKSSPRKKKELII